MKNTEIFNALHDILRLITEIKEDHMNLYDEISIINKKIEYRERNLVDVEEVYQLMEMWDFDDIDN